MKTILCGLMANRIREIYIDYDPYDFPYEDLDKEEIARMISEKDTAILDDMKTIMNCEDDDLSVKAQAVIDELEQFWEV